ncbi:secreted trypsin-like serine protease [Actinopolyspora biskrensis]|uniref:Secreted trypsin-like serine protease n=1 Tax=Actinopolyspora biskrensis TaxID=1470178 RepID=A0A852YRS8_9ACTN|nr:serine protease [Actinopolyspora biskrensis]NYH77944.1 secreted trypsin-like serine protease [Actinopolyspora biskrensis]
MRQRVWRNRSATLLIVAALWVLLVPAGAVASESQPAASSSAAAPIVGGEPAEVADHPWVVYLVDTAGKQFCGGTIAAPDKVVTAGHCVADQRPDGIRVVAGRTDKNTQAGTVAGVSDIWVHPEYTDPYRGADVAVLTLRDSLSRASLPLASAEDDALYRPGTRATVLGWGATSEGGGPSDILRKATVPVIADSECRATYGSNFVAGAMVCAGYAEGGVDGCQGDSGGPLVAGDKLIGVVSWGIGCARPGKPGVYTEVASYADQIRAQLS